MISVKKTHLSRKRLERAVAQVRRLNYIFDIFENIMIFSNRERQSHTQSQAWGSARADTGLLTVSSLGRWRY